MLIAQSEMRPLVPVCLTYSQLCHTSVTIEAQHHTMKTKVSIRHRRVHAFHLLGIVLWVTTAASAQEHWHTQLGSGTNLMFTGAFSHLAIRFSGTQLRIPAEQIQEIRLQGTNCQLRLRGDQQLSGTLIEAPWFSHPALGRCRFDGPVTFRSTPPPPLPEIDNSEKFFYETVGGDTKQVVAETFLTSIKALEHYNPQLRTREPQRARGC